MILALDIGTTTCKGCGFDANTLAPVTRWHRVSYEDVSRPSCWYDASLDILGRIQGERDEVKLVVLSGMMQNVILPLRNSCVLYNDVVFARAAHEELVKCGVARELKEKTGNYKDSASCAAKLYQLELELGATTGREPVLFGAHSYVTWRMLGGAENDANGLFCDPTTASTTGLVDAQGWLNEGYLESIGISKFKFPVLLNKASQIVGRIRSVPNLKGIPIVHGSGDLGSLVAAVDRWECRTHAYIGTSGWIATVVDRDKNQRQPQGEHIFQLAHPLDSSKIVHAIPTTSAGFNASKWAATLFHSSHPATLDEHASRAPIMSPMLYLPHLKGERAPLSMPDARGCFLGLSEGTSLQEMARAVLVGVAYQYKWMLESFNLDGHICLLGGGSHSSLWRQIFADVLQVPMKSLRDADVDETVWGAACIGWSALHDVKPSSAQLISEFWVDSVPTSSKELQQHYQKAFSKWKWAVITLRDFMKDQPLQSNL